MTYINIGDPEVMSNSELMEELAEISKDNRIVLTKLGYKRKEWMMYYDPMVGACLGTIVLNNDSTTVEGTKELEQKIQERGLGEVPINIVHITKNK